MKTAVLYYSSNGNTTKAAETIAEVTGADLIFVEPEKDIPKKGFFRYVIGGFSALTKRIVKLKPLSADLSSYDRFFIGSPVWAKTITPAIRTVLTENNFTGKEIALFACCGDNQGKAFDAMKELIPSSKIIGEERLIDPLKNGRYLKKISRWAKELSEGAVV